MELRAAAAAAAARPLQFVKVLSWTLLVLILGFSLALSVVLSNYAERVLLEKQKQFALLLTENLSHQIYTRFTLPTIIGYGSIALSNKEQFARLDQVIRTTIHSFHVQDLRLYSLYDSQVVYALDPELVGAKDKAGAAVQRVRETGENHFEFFQRTPRLLALFLPDLKPGTMVLRGFAPVRAERKLMAGDEENPLMGILEFSQDVTEDYVTVLNFERLVIIFSLLTSLGLFGVIMVVIRRADRLNMERVSEKERLERELLQQEKLAGMGRMVAGVAHEIRNPLGIICSSAELVLKRARTENSPQLRILEALYDESKRLSRTVGDFLDYARPRQPRQDEVDLCRTLEQAAVFLEPECEKQGVVIERQCPPSLPMKGDRDLLYRAFYNLIANAMQAMEAQGGGRILVQGALDQDAVRVSVTDSGPGFPEDSLEQAKDPFFTTRDNGTGLGLAIVNSIVESHGGRLTLSNSPEGGARVDIAFPHR